MMSAEFDAFFSYRRADVERAQPLLVALEAAGVRVWRDLNDLPDNAPITPEIRNAIAGSKALIALYSADYPLSHGWFEELSTAWIAAQQAGELPYSRVLVLNPESSVDHISRVLREQQSIRWSSGFTALAERIRAHVDGLTGSLHKAEALARPEYHPVALIAAPRFVGRVRELWDLHGQLTADRMTIISGVFGPAAAQVRGMGGNGKSMLAREYALRFGAAFPGGVFWLNAFGNDDSIGPLDAASREALRRDQVRTFAVRCGVAVEGLDPEQVEAAFWARLKEQAQPCLWIVDDLPSGLAAGDIERSWAARWSGAATLITTRSTEYRSIGNGINLEVLEEYEAFELLTFRRPPRTEAEHGAAREIVQKLGCHPLAVEVAGSYVARGFATYPKYLASLSDPALDAVEFGAELKEALPTGHARSISTTLLRSMNMLGADGAAFVALASVLAVAPIPVSFVESVFDIWPEPRPQAKRGIDEADSLSLAKIDSEDARTVHTLIARALRHLKAPTNSFRSAAIWALLKLLPDAARDIRRHGEIRRELVHARHLIAGELKDPQTIDVAMWVARHDSERGDYAAARPLEEQVLEARRRLLGADHPYTLGAMNNLAETVRAQGDLARARELQEQVLEDHRRLLGDEHPDTLTATNNLALTMQAQGDLARVQELQEQVLEGRRRLLGDEHPDTLTATNNLAGTMQAQGVLAGAQELQEQVLESRRRLLGADHPDTLGAMNNLAETMRAQGDLAGARELQEQVLEGRRRLLGAEHPDTLTATNNLAQTVQSEGDLERARELQEQVLEARRRLLGTEHPRTLTAMNNLAQTLYAQGDLAGARELQERMLEASWRLLGAEHPHTLSAIDNLARMVQAQGDPTRARELREQVLEASKRLLGAEHPDTLRAMNNLAQTLYAQDLAGARELFDHVLEASRRLLGAEHPDTSIAAWNLCRTLLDIGHSGDAVAVAEDYLHPLLSKDPALLSADQREIVQMLGEMVRGQSAG
jgi:tetratricopeptide (TPR) repeat protein